MPGKCTHSSDWWKHLLPCCACGAIYSDVEAEAISQESKARYATFTAEQQRIIAAYEAENEELDGN